MTAASGFGKKKGNDGEERKGRKKIRGYATV
jgi:hypothetical protein